VFEEERQTRQQRVVADVAREVSHGQSIQRHTLEDWTPWYMQGALNNVTKTNWITHSMLQLV